MRRSAPTILSIILTLVISSTTFAGHIAGGRAAGNIAGGRAAGNIAGGRATGNIAGGRTAAAYPNSSIAPNLTGAQRLNFEGAFSSTLTGLIRMLLESGALI